MRARQFRALVTLGAGLGLIVSIFAALEYVDASLSSLCTVNAVVSCKSVLLSGKTTTFGIQDWAWGVGGFLLILALAVVLERRRKEARLAYLLLLVTSSGVALAAYFGYVEVIEIGALCLVCLLSYVCGIVAWVGALGLARRAYRRAHAAPPAATAGAGATPPSEG